jgi:superfamily II DNA/RNA helicase
LAYSEKDTVDVALATNMISVGLDITRLGLMVVLGQPKTSAEYIQATSRVGRDANRPGLIVTLLNIHRPRDRSHYERFAAYHETFYRSVEATSVTPFAPRALDRGLAGTLVGLARLGHSIMTPAKGASEILKERRFLDFVVEALRKRARDHDKDRPDAEALAAGVSLAAAHRLDEWEKIAHELHNEGGSLQYQNEAGAARPLLHQFLDPALQTLPEVYQRFRANRSLRDVEPSVRLWVRNLDGIALENDQ